MNLPPLNGLRAFEAVARHLSFSKAGDELHVTHSAISHQIKRLEEWFGKPLFHRGGASITLSRDGAALLASVGPAFSSLDQACQKLKYGADRPRVTVGCIASIASRWLVPNLSIFLQANQKIELTVLYANPQQRLSNSADLDVLITLVDDVTPATESRKLFSRANKPVCSPHYLAQHGPLRSNQDIAAAHLLHDETLDGWSDWFRSAGVTVNSPITGPVFQDFNLLATAAIAGHGIALCPIAVFRDELNRGDLCVVSNHETLADSGYYITTFKDAPGAVRVFTNWFLEISSAKSANSN